MAVKPTLYIGLGGTGIQAIAHTKKMFEDEFGKGNIPPEIQFLAIDFDMSAPDRPDLATDMHDDFPHLHFQGFHLKDCPWMFDGNASMICPDINDYHIQQRQYGRYVFENYVADYEIYIRDCLSYCKSLAADISSDSLDVHIVTSLVGGTGAGLFLNVAQMVRDLQGDAVNIVGYGVLHGVFRAMDVTGNKTPRVVANAYASILDLDYLMTASKNNPIEVSFNGRTSIIDMPIYDQFYVINNKKENGYRVYPIDELSKSVGTCLFASAMNGSVKYPSVYSPLNWKNGWYDIPPKRGWVQALGICQVVYNGELSAEVYALQAALSLIRSLRNREVDANSLTDSWMIVNSIIAYHNSDFIIDSIYDINREGVPALITLDIKDSFSDIITTIDAYTTKMPNFRYKTDEVTESFRKKVHSFLSMPSGVGNGLYFLNVLECFLNVFRKEIEKDQKIYYSKVADVQWALEAEFMYYKEYSKNIFKSKRHLSVSFNNICTLAQKVLRNKIESARRAVALNIYDNLLDYVGSMLANLESLNKKLSSIEDVIRDTLHQKQCSSESSVFEYDLSVRVCQTMKFHPNDYYLYDYFKFIDKPLLEVNVEKDLEKSIYDYCSKLPETQVYRDKLIVDVINDLNDEEYEGLKNEIEKKSSRLLSLEDKGLVMPVYANAYPTTQMVQNYFIYLYQRGDEKSRLERDSDFLRRTCHKEFIGSNYESMRHRIIISRSDMAIIPYCIGAFSENVIDKEYKHLINNDGVSYNPHIDKQLFEQMQAIDFKLKPERENSALFYWVCGQFFGWEEIVESQFIMEKEGDKPVRIDRKEEVLHKKYIRCCKGKYLFWNNLGREDADGEKWQPLGNTTQRDAAFRYFKTTVLPEHKNEYHDLILNVLRTQGVTKFVLMIQDVISGGMPDYIDKIACTDKNSLTYSAKQNGETDLFCEEWSYIENELINAIQNFK